MRIDILFNVVLYGMAFLLLFTGEAFLILAPIWFIIMATIKQHLVLYIDPRSDNTMLERKQQQQLDPATLMWLDGP